MIKRLKRFWLHLFWKYTATTIQITNLESKRYCEYLTTNFTELEQLNVLKKLKLDLIEHRENQIKDKEINIIQETEDIKTLNHNLDKIKLEV